MAGSPPVWEDGSWTVLPSLAYDITADACVIGLGGSGLACVHELLDLGLSVVGVDAGAVASGAAGRNGGFLLAGCYDFYHDAIARHGHDRARTIYRATLDEIDRIADETPDVVRRLGSVRLAISDEERADCERQLEAMRADDLPVEPYDGPEGTGLLIPSDASFDPLRRARTLAGRALERGATLFENTRATEIAPGVVDTGRARIQCDIVVVAVDGGLARVLPELDGRARAARLQMLSTEPTNEVSIERPVYARNGLDYWQQLTDGRIALGGFRDFGGDAEWTMSTETTPLIQGLLERLLREVVGVSEPIDRRWAGIICFSDNGLPIFEEVRQRVWAIGAYSGTGNVIGPLCGRAVARLAVNDDRTMAAPFLNGRAFD